MADATGREGKFSASIDGSFTVNGKVANGEGSPYRERDGTWRATYLVPGVARPKHVRGRTRDDALRRRDEALPEVLEAVALQRPRRAATGRTPLPPSPTPDDNSAATTTSIPGSAASSASTTTTSASPDRAVGTKGQSHLDVVTHAAGGVALLLEAHPNLSQGAVRERLQNSADPTNWSGNPALGLLDFAFRQGVGMLDLVRAVQATTTVKPSQLALGEIGAGPTTVTRTLRNDGAFSVAYDLGHVAGFATGTNTTATRATPSGRRMRSPACSMRRPR